MSFGVGLGAFVEGLDRGMAMRERIDARNKQNKIDQGLKQIEAETAEKFADPLSDEAYDFQMRRQELLYRQNGDMQTALAFRKFAESDAARRGTKLFASSLFKAQTGDAAGALDDAIKAGKVNGYLDHGYELVGQDTIQDKDGATVGYRLKVKGPDGKEVDQDIAIADIPRLVATFANPQAAFESQQKLAEEKRKGEKDLETYEAKKKIDRQYDKPKGDDAGDYRKVAEDLSKSDLDWSDRSPDEQDRMIRDRLTAAKKYASDQIGTVDAPGLGQPAAPGPAPDKVILDQATGQVVQPGTQPVGLGAPPAPAAPTAPADAQRASAAAPQATPPQAPKGPSKEQIIADAANYAGNGGNPELIAQQLMNAGIAEQDWPQQVRTAMAKRNTAAPIGLGR